jgi:hypothetical protein
MEIRILGMCRFGDGAGGRGIEFGLGGRLDGVKAVYSRTCVPCWGRGVES